MFCKPKERGKKERIGPRKLSEHNTQLDTLHSFLFIQMASVFIVRVYNMLVLPQKNMLVRSAWTGPLQEKKYPAQRFGGPRTR